MATKRACANGISRQTAQNILDIAHVTKIKIGDLEQAIGMKPTTLSRIARDTAGHRLYAQDIVFAAEALNVSVDDIVNWQNTSYSRSQLKIRNFLYKIADDTEKSRLKWQTGEKNAKQTVYTTDIANDAKLCVDTGGIAWLETENTSYPLTNTGNKAALAIIAAIAKPPDIPKHAIDVIDQFMSEERGHNAVIQK